MHKFRILVAGCLLLAGAASAQKVYKWVDEDGVVHYSDQPRPGAEEIELPRSRSTVSPRPPAPASAAAASRAAEEPAASANEPFSYESLSFSSPTAEETLWNIGGTLSVSLNVQPSLRSGDRVRVYFDGEQQQVSGLSFQLEEVWRGTHNLQAEIVDRNGQLMIRTEPLRFYVQQTSILNP
ncbi:MAG: DUF4124 domain-containing protein [Woeseiaceae bacterium]|nr:DUF4124 domain-containing protein [Woeseiaceae bacterium]